MDPKQKYRAVGVFANHFDTENALLEIKNGGFPMDQISVVGRNADTEDKVAGVEVQSSIGNKADEGAVTGAVAGGTIGGIAGLLVGLGTLAIPGVGPILLAGTAATALVSTLAGTAIGAGSASLLGALIGLGIPDNDAETYSDLIQQGYYLVVVDGTESQIRSVQEVFARRGIREWQIYNVTTAPVTKPVH